MLHGRSWVSSKALAFGSRWLLRATPLVVALLAGPVEAQEPKPALAGRTQLQLQLGLVDYSAKVVTPKSSSALEDSNQTEGAFGMASRVGVGVGYHFLERLQLHVQAGVASTRNSTKLVESDRTTSGRSVSAILLPSVRYMCNDANPRFWVGAGLGYAGGKTETDNKRLNVSQQGLLVGGMAGVYWFVTEHFSIDPSLEIYFNRASHEVEQEVGDSYDTSRAVGRGVRLMLTVGLSGWLNRRTPARVPAAPVVQPTAQDAHTQDAHTQELLLPDPPLPPVPAPAPAPHAPDAQIFSSKIADLTFELHGNPKLSGTELTVVVTHHVPRGEEPKCAVALVHDRGTHRLDVSWEKNGSDTTGALETTRARASLEALTTWATGQPHLSVCGVKAPLDETVRAQLEATLVGFRKAAEAAGTRPTMSAAVSLQAGR